ncbi:Rrf2 family transcriptional regulator [candidate division KSB1 bacterium]|nr:Rrf2 family transcriptional regulator [candidate division KSB1 bacterium]NIR70972.1 Rrf2 family transcriptional regulator [candidate division KSB1 bacterium]NIS24708.1 Rrf2 family transcriptional regulator [candidate division KSB1 bacterium]NIT71617.1 Rrf2 family transcriptional regulator [candidate division KSB1 bacterium]NIU25321.1 Rrf2 family transcriptional regulator [candidate division KSB1 bacterium]
MSVIFTRACEYAVRGLVEMARHPETESWTIPEIAEASSTPAPFLAKTFQLLVKGRVLNSARGRQGGFTFARPTDQIFLIEIVEIIDGTTLTHDCALGLPECNDDNPCPFHEHWKRVRVPLIEALSQESLAHLAKQPTSFSFHQST